MYVMLTEKWEGVLCVHVCVCVPCTTTRSEIHQIPNKRIPAGGGGRTGGSGASAHAVIYLAVCLCLRPSLSLLALYFVSPPATPCAQEGVRREGAGLVRLRHKKKKNLLTRMGL